MTRADPSPTSASTVSAPAEPGAGQKIVLFADGPIRVSEWSEGSSSAALSSRNAPRCVCASGASSPAAICGVTSASANCSANRSLSSEVRRSSQSVALVGAASPSARMEAGIDGSTARIAGVPSTASSCAVSRPSGLVRIASASEAYRPRVVTGPVIGTTSETDPRSSPATTSAARSASGSVPASYVASTGYTPCGISASGSVAETDCVAPETTSGALISSTSSSPEAAPPLSHVSTASAPIGSPTEMLIVPAAKSSAVSFASEKVAVVVDPVAMPRSASSIVNGRSAGS